MFIAPCSGVGQGAGIRLAVEQEAHRLGIKLNVRLRFSSYPQLAQAVQHLGVAAIMPKLAAASFDEKIVRAVPLPFLGTLSRQVSLVWNRKAAEVRPAMAKYGRLLPTTFRMGTRFCNFLIGLQKPKTSLEPAAPGLIPGDPLRSAS